MLGRRKKKPVSRKALSTEHRCAGGVEYTLSRKRVKNLNIRVHSDGSVAVSASPRVSDERVDDFVSRHRDWVMQTREEFARREAFRAAAPLPDREKALEQLTALARRWYDVFEEDLPDGMPEIRLREMKSSWGVCCPGQNRITFAHRLAAMPPEAQEYVVVHEFCHFFELNHSPAFWSCVEEVLPDWKARRALLNGAGEG